MAQHPTVKVAEEEARTVFCRYCRAPIGNKCVSGLPGKKRSRSHVWRRADYLAKQDKQEES